MGPYKSAHIAALLHYCAKSAAIEDRHNRRRLFLPLFYCGSSIVECRNRKAAIEDGYIYHSSIAALFYCSAWMLPSIFLIYECHSRRGMAFSFSTAAAAPYRSNCRSSQNFAAIEALLNTIPILTE